MRTEKRLSRLLTLCTVAACCLALLSAPAAMAQPIIKAGTDVLQTLGGNGTVYSFANNPLPAGFFCPGSAPFTGKIQLAGQSVLTKPAGVAAQADTVLERLADANLLGGSDAVPVVVRAMSLRGLGSIDVLCPNTGLTRFRVDACTCGEQPITKIEISLEDPACGCGTFSGEIALNVCLSFTNTTTGDVLGPVSRPVSLKVDKSNWCQKAGNGATNIAEAYHVATTCGYEDYLAVPATANFHPGWDCASSTSGLSCLDLYGHLTTCHSSFGQADHDHCINPVCCDRKGQSCP